MDSHELREKYAPDDAERSTPAARAGGGLREAVEALASQWLRLSGTAIDEEVREWTKAAGMTLLATLALHPAATGDVIERHTKDTACPKCGRVPDEERDRRLSKARARVAALEAENARLTAQVERVEALAGRWISPTWSGPVMTVRMCGRELVAALSDTTGEATSRG